MKPVPLESWTGQYGSTHSAKRLPTVPSLVQLSWNYWFSTTDKLKTLQAKSYPLLLSEELSICSSLLPAPWFLRLGLKVCLTLRAELDVERRLCRLLGSQVLTPLLFPRS